MECLIVFFQVKLIIFYLKNNYFIKKEKLKRHFNQARILDEPLKIEGI
jgi:hypothetical protein